MQNQPVRDVEERTLTDRPKLEQSELVCLCSLLYCVLYIYFFSIDLSTSSPMPPSSSESGGSSKSNESLPSNKSESTKKVVDNFMNNQATNTDTDTDPNGKKLFDADA